MENQMNLWIIFGGLFLGVLFGVVVQRSRFCMTAVVTNWVLIRDTRQLSAYGAAILVALVGTTVLEMGGWVDIAETSYRNASLDWVGAIAGGLMFGVGSVFAGGCAGRILVRTGEGDLAALLGLMAFAGAATTAFIGFLEPVRVWLIGTTALDVASGDASLAAILGLPQWFLAFWIALIILALLIFTRNGNKNTRLMLSAAFIGALVVAGWFITGHLAQDGFNELKPTSITFSGPLARTTLYLMANSTPASYFSIVLVSGVLLGSFLSAISSRTFHITAPDAQSVSRILSGGLLMGVGAIFAGGCNIGQGLTGVSTLSIESIIALAAIFSGMYLGVKWLQRAEETGSFWKLDNPQRVTNPAIG